MLVRVKVTPLSKKEEVKEIGEGEFSVKVSEPPVGGRANRRVTELLARHFGVAPSRVTLIKGYSSRSKLFRVDR